MEETPEIEEVPETVEASQMEEMPEEPPVNVQEDPGHMMTPEEIAALMASMEAPEVSEEAETVEEVPQVEEIPEMEETPEIQEVPDMEETPEIEEVLETEEVPEIEEAPQMKEMPEESPVNVQEDPGHMMTPEEIAALMASMEAPEESEEAETVEEVPQVEEMPEIEEAPEIEEMPEIEEAPEIEEMPEIEEAPEIEESTSEPDPSKQMTAEEIAKLLESIPELDEEENAQSVAPEESADDIDVSELMDLIPEDEGISEINDLLEKNDSGEPVEDDMLAMLEQADNGEERMFDHDEPIDIFASDLGDAEMDELPEEISIQEIGESEKEKAPKEKKSKKEKLSRQEKKAKKAQQKEEKKKEKPEKKKGFFAKLIDSLTEEDSEDDITIPPEELDGTADNENLAILQAIDNAPKAEGKAKKKKEKKPKKEKAPKEKKEKKPKKPKKEKKPKEKVAGPPEKKISKKKVIPVFLVLGSLLAAFLVILQFYPKTGYVRHAQECFDQGDYETAYQRLAGLELSEEEEELYRKAALLMKMQRKADAYKNYDSENDMLHVIDALVQAVKYHGKFENEAAERGVEQQFDNLYQTVLAKLQEYEMTEEQAKEFAAITDQVDYSIALEDFVYGPQEPSEVSIETEETEAALEEELQTEETAESDNTSEEESSVEENAEESTDETGEEESQQEQEKPEETSDSNVSEGGERLLYEFGVQKGSDGKYHGGQ